MHAMVNLRMAGRSSHGRNSPRPRLVPRLVPMLLLAFTAVFASACASAEGKLDLAKPNRETMLKVAAAERAYRKQAPEYPAMRDELAGDPVAAGWLTRLFIRDLILRREGRPLGVDQDLLRAAASIEDPIEQGAIQEITILGKAAVPVLVGDLLLYPQPQPRELGIELLGYVGSPAVPRLLEVARSTNALHRRVAARALAHFTAPGSPQRPEVIATLTALTKDAEFTVRADAVRGLRNADADAAELLRTMVRDDPDPFVRRTAAAALGAHLSRATAIRLVEYLDRCKHEIDTRGYETAQDTLQAMAGARGPRTVEAWLRWAENQPQTP